MHLPHNLVTILGVFSFGSQVLAQCNADNCYRALFPCPSPSAVSAASAFCATITASGTTATDFPTRATAACGTAPARYVSACSCGPTCLPTPPCQSTGLIPNGDFECGIEPWTVDVPDENARAGVVFGSANAGQRSLEARLLRDRPLQEPPLSVRVNSSVISVQRNVPCKLKFATWFDNGDAGFVGVRFNGEPKRTVDARDGAGVGVWKMTEVDYTPNTDSVQISFEFLYTRVKSVVRLDSVVFDYLH